MKEYVLLAGVKEKSRMSPMILGRELRQMVVTFTEMEYTNREAGLVMAVGWR